MSDDPWAAARELVRNTERDLFESTGRIFTRIRGDFDDDAGAHDDADEDVKYDGELRVRPVKALARVVDVGGRVVSLHTYIVRAPEDVPGVAVNDRVRITGSPDDHLVGKVLRVADEPGDEWVIHRRLTCVEEAPSG